MFNYIFGFSIIVIAGWIVYQSYKKFREAFDAVRKLLTISKSGTVQPTSLTLKKSTPILTTDSQPYNPCWWL